MAAVWLAMSDVTGASSKSSTWNIISTCCIASRAHWPDPGRWSSRRRAGLWPASFDEIWQSLIERHGKQSGTKQMIEVLMLTRQTWP